jgi:hypothetical protein
LADAGSPSAAFTHQLAPAAGLQRGGELAREREARATAAEDAGELDQAHQLLRAQAAGRRPDRPVAEQAGARTDSRQQPSPDHHRHVAAEPGRRHHVPGHAASRRSCQ